MDYEELYHYTNFDTLTKIINNKTFRFTTLLDVDDDLESDLKEYSNLASYKFVSCWTDKEKEDINFWRNYTSNIDSGIRIKMKTNPFTYEKMKDFNQSLNSNINVNISDHSRVKGTIHLLQTYNSPLIDPYPQLVPVTYTDNKLLLDEKVIKTLSTETNTHYETKYIGWFKNRDWESQEEVRYIITLGYTFQELNKLNNMNFSQKDSYLKSLTLPKDLRFIDLSISDKAIESMEILLSPTFNLENELNYFLKTHNLSIPINKSKIKTKW